VGLKIGVAGTGRLGREHVRVLCGLDGVDAVGCHDIVAERAGAAAGAHGATAYSTLDAMLDAVDAVVVAVPTTEHPRVTLQAIEHGCDAFVEKPIAGTVGDAEAMIAAARSAGRILQVGHVERFNDAFQLVLPGIERPSFIEVHRLAPFTVRGTDVSVVGDLMIHDLDLLNHILGEWPTEIRAAGAAILTEAADIVNARLEYPGGCVANVTASRMTISPMRKIRVFSPSSYLSIDLLAGRATRYRKAAGFDRGIDALRSKADGFDALSLRDFVEVDTVTPDPSRREEPLRKELDAFRHAVETREPPPVTGEDGLGAVRLATEILDAMGRGHPGR
jgi:predicted dehydrogenase